MILGIGSRINRATHDTGVVTNVTSKQYWVTFIENGLETIDTDENFEVIEAVEDKVDSVSFYEVESIFRKLLKKYSDISEIVNMIDKWKGGTMELHPADSNLQSKETPYLFFLS